MSKELTYNGKVVGSYNFFKEINERTYISKFMSDTSGYRYKDAMNNLCSNIRDCVSEIYEDLKQSQDALVYIDSADKSATIKFLYALNDVLNRYGSGGRVSECVTLLSSSKTQSNASVNEVSSAVSQVSFSMYLGSSYERLSLMQKVIDYGIEKAVTTDQQANFISQVMGSKNTTFLKDTIIGFNYKNNTNNYKGRCGKVICKSDYISYYTSKIFNNGSSMYSSTSTSFLQNITIGFNEIIKQIESAESQGERDNDYMKTENCNSMYSCLRELNSVGVSGNSLESRIERFNWYVGGNESNIKALQRALNNSKYISCRLAEDGVYGEKTDSSFREFITKFSDRFTSALKTTAYVIDNFLVKTKDVAVFGANLNKAIKSMDAINEIMYVLEIGSIVISDFTDGDIKMQEGNIDKIIRSITEYKIVESAMKAGAIGGGKVGMGIGSSVGLSAGGLHGSVVAGTVLGIAGTVVGGTVTGYSTQVLLDHELDKLVSKKYVEELTKKLNAQIETLWEFLN